MKYMFIIILYIFTLSTKGQTDKHTFLNDLNNYLSNIKLKSYIATGEYGPIEAFNIIDSTFTIDHYLKIFDKLSLKDNSKLDFLFSSVRQDRGRIDSRLKIYAYRDTTTLNRLVKKEMQRLIMRWDSVIQSKIEINKVKKDPSFSEYIWISSKDTLSFHFEPEKSKEGYLQYLTFYLTEKSGLHWYGYNGNCTGNCRDRIIISTTDLKKIFEPYRNDPGFNQKLANELLSNWPFPIIEISDNQCFITLMEADPWNNLARRKYQVDLNSLKITKLDEKLFAITSTVSFD